ncbi:MAG: hypothetical protein OER95_13670 [Acidimicrobiia bacterium]|nr:hypothetical protein [Acidimicrobiia bacterium]
MTTVRAILLGLRFLRSPGGRFRLLLMAVGVFVATFAILSLAAVPSVVEAQQTRYSEQSLIRHFLANAGPTFTARREDDLWRGRFLTRIVVADGGSGAPPPAWLDRFPEPGEMLVSPAMKQARADHPELTVRFPQTVVGEIRPAGLLDPDQLLAVVGVTGAQLDAVDLTSTGDTGLVQSGLIETGYRQDNGVVGFGSAGRLSGLDPRGVRFIVLGVTIFVLVPTAILVAGSARLSWRTMERRLAALRLVGITRRRPG